MKLNKLFVLLGLVGFTFLSCSDDDDDHVMLTDEAVVQTFLQMYPGVLVTEWELDLGLYKADFLKDGKPAEAWFKPDGTWVKTETDLLLSELPQAVKDYIGEHYVAYRVDDVEWVETPDGSYYLLELDAKGADVYLQILPDGTLLS